MRNHCKKNWIQFHHTHKHKHQTPNTKHQTPTLMPGKSASNFRSPVTPESLAVRCQLNTQFSFYTKFHVVNSSIMISRQVMTPFTCCGRKLIRTGTPPSRFATNQKLSVMSVNEEANRNSYNLERYQTWNERVPRIVRDSYAQWK